MERVLPSSVRSPHFFISGFSPQYPTIACFTHYSSYILSILLVLKQYVWHRLRIRQVASCVLESILTVARTDVYGQFESLLSRNKCYEFFDAGSINITHFTYVSLTFHLLCPWQGSCSIVWTLHFLFGSCDQQPVKVHFGGTVVLVTQCCHFARPPHITPWTSELVSGTGISSRYLENEVW